MTYPRSSPSALGHPRLGGSRQRKGRVSFTGGAWALPHPTPGCQYTPPSPNSKGTHPESLFLNPGVQPRCSFSLFQAELARPTVRRLGPGFLCSVCPTSDQAGAPEPHSFLKSSCSWVQTTLPPEIRVPPLFSTTEPPHT